MGKKPLYKKVKEEKLLIALAAVFWLFLFLATVHKNYAYFARANLPYEMGYILFEAFLIWILAALLAPVFIWLTKKYPIEGDEMFRKASIHIFLSILIVPIYALLFEMIMFPVYNYLAGPEIENLTWNLSTFFASYIMAIRWLGIIGPFVYWLVLGSYHIKSYYSSYKQRQLKNMRMEAELASIRLHVLKVQLHPHFLFNTLHNVHSLIREDPRTAEKMLCLLKRFLQLSIQRVDEQKVPLRDEIEFTSIYLEIEKTRFSNRLAIETAIGSDTLDAKVPSLILQPLVENAVRHGISKKIRPGTLRITARKNGDILRLVVEDDGPGLNGKVQLTGIGLENIRQRLTHLYEKPLFELVSSTLGGLKVQIEIPYEASLKKVKL